uniref:CNNM transmembrane domain-containing protein n=1 Tax=Proboscia inermis TaxID=420281 RepID=A0A6T8MPS7_9STRA|mmetsp:Transcript_43492/g.44002  ORF Transcript_43492/g.44002 Transcript_43492/m.44002 type:complete len:309 (+) Transcript_43492:134-1060(+)
MFVFGHILIVSFLFLHSVQNVSSNSEFSQGRKSSALRGRLKDLAILNDDNPASTTNSMQQSAVRFVVCSTDNCQFKENLPLFSKKGQSNAGSLDEEGLQFATTFTMSDIEQLVGLLENRKRSIYVGEQTQQPSEYAELLRRLFGFKHEEFKIEHPFPYFDMFMTIMCFSFAALAAGLTMGMMSIDPLLLKVKLRGGTELEKEQAKKIYPLIQNHHRLLVTLLLMNSLANEMLPLFLDNMLPRFAAIILSVTLVLFFGEIIPSAVFTGPDQVSEVLRDCSNFLKRMSVMRPNFFCASLYHTLFFIELSI